MRPTGLVVLAMLAAAIAGCASRIVPAPALRNPIYPEFAAPVFPSGERSAGPAVLVDRGWRFLQAADLANAERELRLALRAAPMLYQAEAVLGYVAVARKQPEEALAAFDRALARDEEYAPAWVGRGQTLEVLGRDDDAFAAFERALVLDPSHVELGRRVDVLVFRRAEQRVERARQAAEAGRVEDAVRAYEGAIQDSPGSSFLYRELAAVEMARGEPDAALAHWRTAASLEPSDAATHVRVAELLEARGDLDAAVESYEVALGLEPSAAVSTTRDRARARAAFQRLPPSFAAIGTSTQVTRGELAALIGVHLPTVLARASDDQTAVVTDARGLWAERWIVAVARSGVMQPYPNHTFLPRAPVRRVELAQTVEWLLSLGDVLTQLDSVGEPPGDAPRRGRMFGDLMPSHASYGAAVAAVRSGAMSTTAGPPPLFRPNAVATGEEAVQAIERLAEVTGAPPLGAAQP